MAGRPVPGSYESPDAEVLRKLNHLSQCHVVLTLGQAAVEAGPGKVAAGVDVNGDVSSRTRTLFLSIEVRDDFEDLGFRQEDGAAAGDPPLRRPYVVREPVDRRLCSAFLVTPYRAAAVGRSIRPSGTVS